MLDWEKLREFAEQDIEISSGILGYVFGLKGRQATQNFCNQTTRPNYGKKNRLIIVNNTYLLQMLTLYQTHLENQLAHNEYLLLCILIDALQNIKEVNLEKLANTLPLPIEFESRRKKLQRFLSLPAFDIEKM